MINFDLFALEAFSCQCRIIIIVIIIMRRNRWRGYTCDVFLDQILIGYSELYFLVTKEINVIYAIEWEIIIGCMLRLSWQEMYMYIGLHMCYIQWACDRIVRECWLYFAVHCLYYRNDTMHAAIFWQFSNACNGSIISLHINFQNSCSGSGKFSFL